MYDTIAKCVCPDCNHKFTLKFCLLLEADWKLVSIGTCDKCNDGRSIRATAILQKRVFIQAMNDGMPVVRYG